MDGGSSSAAMDGGSPPADGLDGVEALLDPRAAPGGFDSRASLGVAALGVMVVAALALVLIISLQGGRRGALDAARAQTVNLARVLADGAARSMEAVDVALTSVGELAVSMGDGPPGPDMIRQIRDRLAYTPVLRQIIVADMDGRVLYDSAGGPVGGRLSLAPYLKGEEATRRALMIGDSEQRRFIGGPAAPGQRLIPVARRVENAEGQPAAMVLGAVNPLHFMVVGGLLDLGPDGWVALYRYDGQLLAGDHDAPLDHGVVAALSRREEAGVRIAAMADGVERIVSYRATSVWPLVVEVGIAKDAALAGWRQTLTDVSLPVTGAAIVLLGVTAALVRMLQRRGHDEAVMRLSDQALRSVRSGVAIVDMAQPGRPIIYVNPAMSDITGLPRDRLLAAGRGASSDGLELLRSVIDAGGGAPEMKEPIRRSFRRDDRMVWVELMLSRVAVGDDEPAHGVVVVNDVSEQITAEQELLRSLDELATLHDEQSRFSEILAHHLQEPVRRIVVHGQLLKRALPPPLPADADAALAVLEVSGRRLKHLLRDVELYLSAGAQLKVTGAASADAALITVLARLRRRLDEAGAQVLRGRLPMVRMAAGPLGEVLHAVLDNALTYRSPDRPLVISVDATRHGDEWIICIEDNGVGIDRGYYERIFRVFERLRTDDEHHGTGIGLALARKVVERAGGRIWVNSEPGLGSRFFIALPGAPENGAAETVTADDDSSA